MSLCFRVDAFFLGFRACGRRSEVSIGGLIPGERESGMGYVSKLRTPFTSLDDKYLNHSHFLFPFI
jgi:hypothetical protein